MQFCVFRELDTREFTRVPTLAAAIRAVRNGDADGLTIDTTDSDGTHSYEVMPYRTIVVWHGDECHE